MGHEVTTQSKGDEDQGRRTRESAASERREFRAGEMRGWAWRMLGGASPAGRTGGASEVEVVGPSPYREDMLWGGPRIFAGGGRLGGWAG